MKGSQMSQTKNEIASTDGPNGAGQGGTGVGGAGGQGRRFEQ